MAPLTAQDRTTAQLAVVFGCVALALAAIGLYGVLSYGIARRRREIAVRIALGARPGRVIAMILRETLGLLIVGLALGGSLAYAASRLIRSQLYGVDPQDPVTLVLAIGTSALRGAQRRVPAGAKSVETGPDGSPALRIAYRTAVVGAVTVRLAGGAGSAGILSLVNRGSISLRFATCHTAAAITVTAFIASSGTIRS